jgi:hypothetical protein
LELAGDGASGGNAATARNFVYYVVSSTRAVLLEMDSTESFGGAKTMQAGTATPRNVASGDAK